MFLFRARKRFGQHFLDKSAIINKMVQAINPKAADNILEIGPGLGALTQQLLPYVCQLTVLELDRDLIPLLKERCASLGELIVYQGDALTFDFLSLTDGVMPWRIVGNLPYNISTPLLFHLLDQASGITDMHFMLQKEVVQRIVAQIGDKYYGRLSVMVQYYCQVKKLFTVKAGAFRPPPKVDSAVIRLIPYKVPPCRADDVALFAKIVRVAFSHRRKMLCNSLGTLVSSKQLESLCIDPRKRPEELSVMNYVTLSNLLLKNQHS